MAFDTKKYLDWEGLVHYDEKIKAYIKTNGSDVTDKLVALIGAMEKGENEATILDRIADLESAVGDVSELGDEVANLVKAILGESSRAQEAESDLQDAIDALDKKLHGDADGADDAAKAGELATLEAGLQANIDALDEKLYGSDNETEGESVHTKGDIDKIHDRLTALEEDTSDADAVKELEDRLYGTDEGDVHTNGTLDEMSIATQAAQDAADAAQADVDALDKKLHGDSEGTTDAEKKGELAVLQDAIDVEAERATGVEEDLQDAIDAEEEARKAQIGDLGKVSEEEGAADHTVKSYVDAKVEEINGDAEELEGRVEALEALHADKKNDDGEVVGKKTVAEEVNEAVVALVDGAPDALDTLKEIADWIANQDDSGVTDAATLVARVEANADAISDEEARAKAIEGELTDLDTDAKGNLVAAINEVNEKVDAFARITESEIDTLFGEKQDETGPIGPAPERDPNETYGG